MRDGMNMIRGFVAGALMGAGALWVMNSMTRGQKRMVKQYANQMACKAAEKANELLK